MERLIRVLAIIYSGTSNVACHFVWSVYNEIIMKYKEDRIIEEISRYIKGTYGEHYSTTKDGFQVQDMLRHLNIDKDFCQANAIKYLCRYGKKAGKNRKDLLKAIHYVILLMSSEDKDKNNEISTNTGDVDAFNGS